MDIQEAILEKLLRKGAIGARHYQLDTFMHMGWKSHERKQVQKSLELLMRRGLVRWYNRHKESIQLTPEGLQEARRLLDR